MHALVEACPKASLNPETKRPFCEKTLRRVFNEDCFDIDPEHPWKFQHVLQKVFLPKDVECHRRDMAKHMLESEDARAPQWWAHHVVWFDPCATIIPGSQNQYDKMRQARKNQRRYISDNAKMYSANLKGPPAVLKQNSWGGTKMNWFMVLARGVMHVEVMPVDWKLNGDGLAEFVERLPRILKKMLGSDARLPRTVFTDRGTGMYNPAGKIVEKYHTKLKEKGFRPFWGADASRQSPDMGDVLLHETAVALFRKRMRYEQAMVAPWKETPDQWTARAKAAASAATKEYDLHGLCREFPGRLRALADNDGRRLKK